MKMKLCSECGAASKEKANFCHRCKVDIQSIKPEKTIYVFVNDKNEVVGGIYFYDIEKFKEFLDKFVEECEEYLTFKIAHCFYSQIVGEAHFEPIEYFEVRYWGMKQFFMPSLKVAPKKPSEQDGSFYAKI
jgi:hypothetical protein